MKKLLAVLMVACGFLPAFSQKAERTPGKYSVAVQYGHEFVLGGYVRVREWDVIGDKMQLKDLGMNNYSAIQLHLQKELKKSRTLSLVFDQFFMRGNSTFDRDIFYNGTIIEGRKGIDVSPTRYYRLTLLYRGRVFESRSLYLGYVAGVVVDHVKFYLDGEVSPSSPKNEVFEFFGRQAFPYPMAGVNSRVGTGKNSHMNLEVSGSYVPEFKSFYTEGGNVYLQYSLFQSDLKYSRKISGFEMVVGARIRYMHLFQESDEDTNVLRTFTAGPYAGIVYRL